ncbi:MULTISPECIES: hypothetical protein [Actinopolyspora]|uniref:Uncharacterized protein n=1 Tax=Actinopolyspora saharensis TaxID=995062 RepID=A0A1H1ECP9_9ACTN|nr:MULTISPECIES: hypothetical protein [Actinopolyspora]NHD19029.1 hypothetical protein [Actinopolyspora sp. BKK2]NHE78186.1 hypothetical protein [Actinopolyspora sp. BKK1]SDQ86308.1 hypothetical protein SAMN04489718_2472 [Actinopolyspora saharensis]
MRPSDELSRWPSEEDAGAAAEAAHLAFGVRERRRALRARWRSATLAAGWPFPADWSCSGVDRVCDAVLGEEELSDAVTELGEQRAAAGIGLDETLRDLAVLHAVSLGEQTGDALVTGDCSRLPAELLHRTAVAWADVVAGRSTAREVVDALTGLTTQAYLRMRLHEVYCETSGDGNRGQVWEADRYELLAVTLPLSERTGRWARMMGVVLAADVLRSVFDSGETLSLLRESTPVVLTRIRSGLAERRAWAELMIADRLRADPELRTGCVSAEEVRLRQLRLPSEYAEACELLDTLG